MMSQKTWIIPLRLVENELVAKIIELREEKAESMHEEFARECADFVAETLQDFDRRQASGLPTYPARLDPFFCPECIRSDGRLIVRGREDIAEAAEFAFNASAMGVVGTRFAE